MGGVGRSAVQLYVVVTVVVALALCFSTVHGAATKFVFSTCKKGFEKLLKHEVQLNYPDLKFAYSRPGLITWKVNSNSTDTDGKLTPGFVWKPNNLVFMRSRGESITATANSSLDVLAIAAHIQSISRATDKLRLHVFAREIEESCFRTDHPLEIAERRKRTSSLRNEILAADEGAVVFHRDEPAEENDLVVDVCIGEGSDRIFMGQHIHSSQSRGSSHPNNLFPHLALPAEAPSRAYLKIEEAIRYFDIPMQRAEQALEIGSAPGGSAYNLLGRGLRVWGVDPCSSDRTHSPVVRRHEGFTEIVSKLHRLQMEQLPTTVQWILCDANISPEEAIPHLKRLCAAYSSRNCLKGLLYTCKLNDEIFSWSPDRIVRYLHETRASLLSTVDEGGDRRVFRAVEMVAVPSHKQEVLLYAIADSVR